MDEMYNDYYAGANAQPETFTYDFYNYVERYRGSINLDKAMHDKIVLHYYQALKKQYGVM